MVELVVAEKRDFNEYVLCESKSEKKHSFGLEFIETPSPSVGDSIFLNEQLLDAQTETFSKNYVFGELSSEYGRKITSKADPDLAVIIVSAKRIVLKRLYG